MSANDTVRVKTNELPAGSRISHPITDAEDRLLLAGGILLTERLIARLLSRGISDVQLHREDALALFGKAGVSQLTEPKPSAQQETKSSVQGRHSEQKEALRETVAQIKLQASALAASVPLRVRNSEPILCEKQKKHGPVPYNPQQRERLAQHFAVTTQVISNIARQAIKGRVQDDQPLHMVTEDYVEELIDDTDSVIASSGELAPDPQISERGVRLALLGMAMAIEMGWDEHNVREVGICGLIHDFGMFRMQKRLQNPQRKITEDDFQQLVDHPLHTLDMLSSMRSVSLPVRLAATQVHENPDGSGYPRNLTGESIHPFASILHAADAYITLTANMHGRRAFLTYDVMVYLLNQVGEGRMDGAAMRALLQVITLFPIGSRVRLSDGTEAQVIRRNGGNYTAPIVQRVGLDRKYSADAPHPKIIDLAAANMRIMSPLTPPEGEVERLEDSLSDLVLWEGVS